MGRFTAYFHFNSEGLWVKHSLLGKKYDFSIDGVQVFIKLPKDNDDFWVTDYEPRDEDLFLIGRGAGTRDVRRDSDEVLVVQVGVEIKTDFDIPPNSVDPELHRKIYDPLTKSAEIAKKAVKRYLDGAAVLANQSWINMQTDSPEFTWMNFVFDDKGNRVRTAYQPPIVFNTLSMELALDETRQKEIINFVTGDESLDLAEEFLRDTQYLRSNRRDTAQMVLYAAIACEIKVKTTLRQLSKPEQVELVELVLENPRDVSLAAISLFHKGCKAVSGKSMKEEDNGLYKEVIRLFEDRNAVAHQGQGPTLAVAIAHVATAARVFKWLDGLKRLK